VFTVAAGEVACHFFNNSEIGTRTRPHLSFWAPRLCRFCLAERGYDGSRGLEPTVGSAKTGRRGATLEGLDWLLGSGVAPRRATFPHHYSVGLSPRLPSASRSATSPKVRCARIPGFDFDLFFALESDLLPRNGPRSIMMEVKIQCGCGTRYKYFKFISKQVIFDRNRSKAGLSRRDI